VDEARDDDYLDIGKSPQPHAQKTKLLVPVVLGTIFLACAGSGFFWIREIFMRPVPAMACDMTGVTNDDLLKRQLTAFVERFLAVYYDYSYTQYDQSVARVELMMTPAFQAAYNQRAEDLDFKRELIKYRVNTDAIRILPGSFAFLVRKDRCYVRLAGSMTYTTGSDGVSGNFPLTLLLVALRTDRGFLMDNVERLR
jgi:hypothetical protein